MHYDFSVCGSTVRISVKLPIQIDEASKQFRYSGEPSLKVVLHIAEKMIFPDVPALGESDLRQVWRNQGIVTRCCRINKNSAPYFRADYQLDHREQVDCCVLEESWDWVGRIQHIWPGIMLNYLLLPFRVLIFHASYIQHDGRAILFTAPSQTGKSTQAELWRVHRGAQVINGDKAGVRLDGAPMAHGVPFSGTSGICRNVSLPLEAIVVLSQAPVNTVRRLPPSEAAAALCGNVFVDHYIPEEWQQALNLLLDLVAGVPVYALACTPDVRAVEALEQAMAREGREKSPVKEAAP